MLATLGIEGLSLHHLHEAVRTHGPISMLCHGFRWLVPLPIRDTWMVMAHQRVNAHGNLIKGNLKIGHDMPQVGLQYWSATVDLVQLV